MMNNICAGMHMPGNSVLHRADPRTKIVLTMFFLVIILTSNTKLQYLALTIFAFTIMVVCRTPIKAVLMGVRPILIIFAVTFLINLLTSANIWDTVAVMFRLVLIVVYSSFLPATTTPITLSDGLESLLKPLKFLKVPVSDIAVMMSITLRFIPILSAEAKRITEAQVSRGADIGTGGTIKRIRSFIPIIVPLFVGALRRADELAEAMDARCYRGGSSRTRMRQLKLRRIDAYVMIVSSVIILIMLLAIK